MFSLWGLSATEPAKSRIVEAVWILLCQKYSEAQGSYGTYEISDFKRLSEILF